MQGDHAPLEMDHCPSCLLASTFVITLCLKSVTDSFGSQGIRREMLHTISKLHGKERVISEDTFLEINLGESRTRDELKLVN